MPREVGFMKKIKSWIRIYKAKVLDSKVLASNSQKIDFLLKFDHISVFII
jgi:hypothetical protein